MVGIVNQRISRNKKQWIKFVITAMILGMTLHFSFAQVQQTQVAIEGRPRVLHYNRKDFDGDPQIWTMCQDRESVLYFGSNNGTLVFDGEKWQKSRCPTIPQSDRFL